MSRVKDKKKKLRSLEENASNSEAHKVNQPNIKDESGEHGENHASRKLRNKKRKNNQRAERETVKQDKTCHETEDELGEKDGGSIEVQDNKKRKGNRRKTKKEKKVQLEKVESEAEDTSEQRNDDKKIDTAPHGTRCETENSGELSKTDFGRSSKTRKSRKVLEKKKNFISSNGEDKLLQKTDAEEEEIYQISSGDEDCSKGMKKWIIEYHQRRPGLKVLQEKIDEFITAHEAQEEQERKEREALAAEDGWTVVTHHKGRKKTTDAETGVTVGSIAQAAVLDNMAKKKNKGVGLDFYRFQRREARKNEIMVLQDKFEQDKKKIQQLRAARKFRPY